MAQYVMPHTSKDEKGGDTLKKFASGSKSGEHTGWAYIDAYINENSEKEE